MSLFKVLWGIDALAAIIVLYFFFIGIADGTVSPRNIGLWIVILLVLGVIMLGSIWLRSHYPAASVGLLCVLAIPAIGYLLFILIAVFGKGRWN